MIYKNNKDGAMFKERTKLVLIKTFRVKVVRNFIKLLPNKMSVKLKKKNDALCRKADRNLIALDIKENW